MVAVTENSGVGLTESGAWAGVEQQPPMTEGSQSAMAECRAIFVSSLLLLDPVAAGPITPKLGATCQAQQGPKSPPTEPPGAGTLANSQVCVGGGRRGHEWLVH